MVCWRRSKTHSRGRYGTLNGSKDNAMEEYKTLDEIERDKEVEVLDIQGGWGARHRLNKMGIHPGDKLIIKRSGVMGGPILIKVHGMEVALGRGMAAKVRILEKE
jgi:ferrous iron transport protein A